MTTLEAINKIKQMFAEAGELPVASVEPTQSFAEYSLKSGAKVMIDKLEVGGKVSLVDEAGVESPAPAGEHELIDGSIIVLDEAATILEIKVPEVEVPEALFAVANLPLSPNLNDESNNVSGSDDLALPKASTAIPAGFDGPTKLPY